MPSCRPGIRICVTGSSFDLTQGIAGQHAAWALITNLSAQGPCDMPGVGLAKPDLRLQA